MKIAVYCGSRMGNSTQFAEGALRLGTQIGQNHHELVYGGSTSGLMGIVADAALAAGAHVIGVVPNIPSIVARKHPGLSEYFYTESLGDRKVKMMELADAYIALPGGVGTLDEVTDIISLARLRMNLKPCILFNIDHFYDPLRDFLQSMIHAGFVNPDEFASTLFSDNLTEMMAFAEQFKA